MLYDSFVHIIESNNESSSLVENFQPENVENLSVLSTRVDHEENRDNATSTTTTESASDLSTNFIVNNLSSANGVPNAETLMRYLQDGPNEERRSRTSGERPDNHSPDCSVAGDDSPTSDRVTDVSDESDLPAASSCVLTASPAESDVFDDDSNSVLGSSFGLPGPASDARPAAGADVAHDSTEPSFETFTRYVQGRPERGNEFSKLEDYLRHVESRGPVASTLEPTTPGGQVRFVFIYFENYKLRARTSCRDKKKKHNRYVE